MFINQLVIYKQLRKVKQFREDRKLRELQKQRRIVEDLQAEISDLEQKLQDFKIQRARASDALYSSIMNKLVSQKEFAVVKTKIYHLHLQQQDIGLQILDYKQQLLLATKTMEERRQEYTAAHRETSKFDEVVKIKQRQQDMELQIQEEKSLSEFIDEVNVLNIEQ